MREWWIYQNGFRLYDVAYSDDTGNICCDCQENIDVALKERNTPLLSIGQCIELLDYLKQCLVIRKKRGIWNCEETWGNSKVELIDALWQAVKEVL